MKIALLPKITKIAKSYFYQFIFRSFLQGSGPSVQRYGPDWWSPLSPLGFQGRYHVFTSRLALPQAPQTPIVSPSLLPKDSRPCHQNPHCYMLLCVFFRGPASPGEGVIWLNSRSSSSSSSSCSSPSSTSSSHAGPSEEDRRQKGPAPSYHCRTLPTLS